MPSSQRSTSTKLTAPEVSKRLRVSLPKVHEFIRGGELRAINIARRGCVRPRYLIDACDLAKFEQRRAVCPEV